MTAERLTTSIESNPEEFAPAIESSAEERRRSLMGLPVIDVTEPRRMFRRRPFKKRQLLLPSLALVVLVGTLAVRPTEEPSIPVPAELIGWWNAADLRYAGSGFRITTSTLTLHVPDSGPRVRRIEAVRVKPDGNDRLYEIDYALASGTIFFNFKYSQDGTIRFPNQSGMVWRRGGNPAEMPQTFEDSVVQLKGPFELPPGLAECIISVTSDPQSRSGPISCVTEAGAWDNETAPADAIQGRPGTR